ncbi:polysaccharide deacetylase family protein [Actinoplanes sp. CA-054009]
MSRVRKAVLLGVVLLAVGLTGRAAAQSTPEEPVAAPTPSVSASASASASAPASVKPKPPAKTPTKAPAAPPKGKPTKTPGKSISYAGGPAGSRTMTGSKGVALTFDDGPDPATTPQLLKMLKQQHVKATFCLVGKNAAKFPDLVRQIAADGHTLCNHTWNHSLKIGKDPEAKIRSDLMRTNNAILRAVPNAKVKYFRAPGGNFTPRLVSVANKLHMSSIYWKLDPRDWDHKKGESSAAHRARVISTIEKHTRPGSIILSHDYAQPDTIAAYRTLLPFLRKRFQLIALP